MTKNPRFYLYNKTNNNARYFRAFDLRLINTKAELNTILALPTSCLSHYVFSIDIHFTFTMNTLLLTFTSPRQALFLHLILLSE